MRLRPSELPPYGERRRLAAPGTVGALCRPFFAVSSAAHRPAEGRADERRSGAPVNATCYTSPKLEGRDIPEKGFKGLFAREAVKAGELLTLYMGKLID